MRVVKRWNVTTAHIASTTPTGHAPERNPYRLARTHSSANASTIRAYGASALEEGATANA
jgi:hypothetical protein